jgi:transcriptional regulator with XRE-family HTH domain
MKSHRRPRDERACEALGAAIRAEREHQGLSRVALSEASGIHRGTIARIERGRCNPRFDTLMKLGRGLGSLASVFARAEAIGW